MTAAGLAAALFDLDGTLVDSEDQTDAVIATVMARHGVAGVELAADATRGRTWRDIVDALLRTVSHRSHGIEPRALERELAQAWADTIGDMSAIPGASTAVTLAKETLGNVAVVSSSPRALVERILSETLGVRAQVDVVVGAEDVVRGKPAPDSWLAATAALGVPPSRCVVFEDSRAGLLAARDAGIPERVVVLHRCAEPAPCLHLARRSITHYLDAGPKLWTALAAGAA